MTSSRRSKRCGRIFVWGMHKYSPWMLNSLECDLQHLIVSMKKRSSKKGDYFDQLRQQNHSIRSTSPSKTSIPRENTCTNFRKQKPIVQFPKIFQAPTLSKHKRYLESCLTHEEALLNLIGTKFYRRNSREHNHRQELISTSQLKRQRPLLDKQETHKQIFLQNVLASNNISRIIFSRKQKLKVFVNEGNNSRLVNELMRRRSNLRIVDSKEEANIVWTQNCDWQQSNKGSFFSEALRTERQSSTLCTENGQNKQSELKARQRKLREIVITKLFIHNHLKHHFQISDKKCLFKNIKKYCKNSKINDHDIIPVTYHLETTTTILPEDICADNQIWIVKPGEDTNRGKGISVQIGRDNILKAVKELASIGKSSLVQEYIDPLLYKNRKFDIRCYALVTSYCGHLKAYWYKEGYLRTCSKEFNYDPGNVYGHLTNDAVQKNHKDYGKYQPCNKLSYSDLEVLLKSKEMNYQGILHRMKDLAKISIKSAEEKLRGDKNMFAFQIFGYDFLIDNKGKVWLIEINTNPCLQFSGSLLSRIIWHMVQNSLAIAVDPFLLDLPESYSVWRQKMDKIYEDNKFQCII